MSLLKLTNKPVQFYFIRLLFVLTANACSCCVQYLYFNSLIFDHFKSNLYCFCRLDNLVISFSRNYLFNI